MPKFISYDYNQNAMVVINYLDQLQPGTFEHAIHYLVENEVDISVYFPAYKNARMGSGLSMPYKNGVRKKGRMGSGLSMPH